MPKAQQLTIALRSNPTLLWEVFHTLSQDGTLALLAGPWTKPIDLPQGSLERRNALDKLLAIVSREPSSTFPWHAQLTSCLQGSNPNPDNPSRPERSFHTQSDAQSWCDDTLSQNGFILC